MDRKKQEIINRYGFKEVNYKELYTDLINKKFPEKMVLCQNILKKEKLSILDAIELHNLLFPKQSPQEERLNQKRKSYMKNDILKILKYQKLHNLTNVQTALKFKLSRNTVTKWKRAFPLFK
ncbi:helix-turn-helix domain-containing protein [Chryseobacterium fluminis]|uniref:helix-turn-helix domain-containing protein n=1 Tax=Chryseobacterium fluminis TaxID=2983606 RepID=UPI00225B2F9C|nr:helix-turn-helix domain-containing protein [Chryseobacterium sp. MMS21-Ot14]UZT97952.1 helix-turn-helix domain-containing protein [Chryseobacterium sp. MMS21-Ot14]